MKASSIRSASFPDRRRYAFRDSLGLSAIADAIPPRWPRCATAALAWPLADYQRNATPTLARQKCSPESVLLASPAAALVSAAVAALVLVSSVWMYGPGGVGVGLGAGVGPGVGLALGVGAELGLLVPLGATYVALLY